MKTIVAFGMLLMMSLFVHAQNSIFQTKSGKITIQVETEEQQLLTSIVYDDFGARQAITVVDKENSALPVMKSILDKEYFYIISFEDNKVMKIPLGVGNFSDAVDLAGMDNRQTVDLFGMANWVTSKTGVKTSEENYLQKACKVFEINSDGIHGKYWIADNMVLKAEYFDKGGNHVLVAVKDFQSGVPVDQSLFNLPSDDFEWIDMSELMKQMQEMKKLYGSPDEE